MSAGVSDPFYKINGNGIYTVRFEDVDNDEGQVIFLPVTPIAITILVEAGNLVCTYTGDAEDSDPINITDGQFQIPFNVSKYADPTGAATNYGTIFAPTSTPINLSIIAILGT